MTRAPGRDETNTVRVARVIARLNIGGPAIQAITLTRSLEPLGYDTTLIRGSEDPDEGSMDYLADELGVRPLTVRSLRRNPGLHDLAALLGLVRELRRLRPQIVHTHAAKAGTLGRLAALIALPKQGRVLVHTFHGHSLTGYFSPRVARIYALIERFLARRTTRLIAVSEEVRDELVRLRIAPAERFDVVPLGFDLSPFVVDGLTRAAQRRALRAELGLVEEARVVTLIARLVPIKRVDRFLRVANLLRNKEDLRFLVIGDGELGDQLRDSAEARALGDQLRWVGFRRDMPAVCFASDVVVLTSDNEGTPVSLIEAQAAGVPVVTTEVGGVRSVVLDGESGHVVPVDDEAAFAMRIRELLSDLDTRRMGERGREHVQAAFALERLVADVDHLYGRLLPPP